MNTLNIIKQKNKLAFVRSLLEKSWTSQTSYYFQNNQLIYNVNKKSLGQCFVTSLLLYNEYYRNCNDYCVNIHRGSVVDMYGSNVLEDHCWLELFTNKQNDVYIIDLTLDQTPLFSKKVLFENKYLINKKYNIHYLTKKIYHFDELKNLKPLTLYRYQQLNSNYFTFYKKHAELNRYN